MSDEAAHNPKVAGSNPAPATSRKPLSKRLSALVGTGRLLEVVPLDDDSVARRLPARSPQRPKRSGSPGEQLERGDAVGGRAARDEHVGPLDERQATEDRIGLAQIGLAVAVAVEGEERIDLLADRAQRRSTDVQPVDHELIALASLIAPEFLVADVDRALAFRPQAGIRLDGVRLEQPKGVVAPHERLVVDVERW